jgi:hypothetical protein
MCMPRNDPCRRRHLRVEHVDGSVRVATCLWAAGCLLLVLLAPPNAIYSVQVAWHASASCVASLPIHSHAIVRNSHKGRIQTVRRCRRVRRSWLAQRTLPLLISGLNRWVGSTRIGCLVTSKGPLGAPTLEGRHRRPSCVPRRRFPTVASRCSSPLSAASRSAYQAEVSFRRCRRSGVETIDG